MKNKYAHPKAPDAPDFPLLPKLLATSFGFGFLPAAPGTWGAVFAILIWLPFWIWLPGTPTFIFTAAATVFFTVAGTWASAVAEKYWKTDPVWACVDETVGQLISLLPLCALPHQYWWEIVLSLALFRLFDIFKPLGIRKIESLPGGYGMMADDILAAIYSCVILVCLNMCLL